MILRRAPVNVRGDFLTKQYLIQGGDSGEMLFDTTGPTTSAPDPDIAPRGIRGILQYFPTKKDAIFESSLTGFIDIPNNC